MKCITKRALPRTKNSLEDVKTNNFDTNRKLDRKDDIEAIRKFEEVNILVYSISVDVL